MTLTTEGLLFKNRAEEILKLYQKAVAELSQQQEISGEIFIGTGETDAFYYLAEIIRNFQNQFPKVQFHIISSNSDTIRDNIDKGLVDIGFLFEPVHIEKYAFCKVNLTERWGVLLPQSHPLADREYIVTDDLKDEKLICPQRLSFQSEIYQWLGKNAEKIKITATYNLINPAIIMTQKEIGVTLCMEKESYTNLGLRFVPLKPMIQSKPILIWKNQKILPPAIEAFLSHINNSKIE